MTLAIVIRVIRKVVTADLDKQQLHVLQQHNIKESIVASC
jgi:hypothetical protein